MLSWFLRRRSPGVERITITLGPKAIARVERMQERLRVQRRIDVLRRALALLDIALSHCGDGPITILSADGRSFRVPSLAEPRLRVIGGRDFDEET